MPKIKKIHENFRGKYTEFIIFFNEKHQFHIQNCPADVIELGGLFNRQNTLSDIIIRFKQALQTYHEKSKNRREVILLSIVVGTQYSMNYTAVGTYSADPSNPFHAFSGSGGFDGISGHGFSIDYKVAVEYSVGEKIDYKNTVKNEATGDYDEGVSAVRLHKDQIVLPYSIDTVAFLDSTQLGLRGLILKVVEFFSQEPATLVQAIKDNTKLLS